MCKANNYYIGGGEGEVVARRLQELEGLCDSLSVEQLQSLNARMSGGSVEEGQAAVEEAVRLPLPSAGSGCDWHG